MAHPHEYALLYGSPGYRATDETARASSRVTAVMAALLKEASGSPGAGDLEPPRVLWPELTRLLATPAFADADGQPAMLPRPVLMRGLLAWVELLGLISFELFGPLASSVKRTDQFYRHAVNLMIGDLF